MKDRHLPKIEDISETNRLNLDERSAAVNFLGKGQLEAERLFDENVVHYGEDLFYMAAYGFQYYFEAFFNYLRSPNSEGDDIAISILLHIIEVRVILKKDEEVSPHLLPCIVYCLDNLAKFDLGSDYK